MSSDPRNLRISPSAFFSENTGPLSQRAPQHFSIGTQRVPNAPPEPQPITSVKDQNFVLGPHATAEVGGVGLTAEYLTPRNLHWFVYGLVTYDDIFPRTAHHMTKYCFTIYGIPAVGEQRPVAGQCSHWNCTDDECEGDKKAYDAKVAAFGKPQTK
jgi:hypothetical protein